MEDFVNMKRDFCDMCFKDEYTRVAINAVVKNGTLKHKVGRNKQIRMTIVNLPEALLKSILEKMSQKSFYRTRRSNKFMDNFIEQHREKININLFHNWSIEILFCRWDFEEDPATVNFRPHIVLRRNQISEYPGRVLLEKVYPVGEIDLVLRESHEKAERTRERNDEERKAKQEHRLELSEDHKYWHARKFYWLLYRATVFSDDYFRKRKYNEGIKRIPEKVHKAWKCVKRLGKTKPVGPHFIEDDREKGTVTFDLEDWDDSDSLRKEFRGNWRPSSVFLGILSGDYHKYSMTRENWKIGIQSFVKFAEAANLSHCYLKFYLIPFEELFVELFESLKPKGLCMENVYGWNTRMILNSPGDFFLPLRNSLRAISITAIPVEKEIMELLPQLEYLNFGFSCQRKAIPAILNSYGGISSETCEEHEIEKRIVVETIRLWSRGGPLKQLKTFLCEFPEELHEMGLDHLPWDMRNQFLSTHPALENMVVDPHSNVSLLKSSVDRRLAMILIGKAIWFYDIPSSYTAAYDFAFV